MSMRLPGYVIVRPKPICFRDRDRDRNHYNHFTGIPIPKGIQWYPGTRDAVAYAFGIANGIQNITLVNTDRSETEDHVRRQNAGYLHGPTV